VEYYVHHGSSFSKKRMVTTGTLDLQCSPPSQARDHSPWDEDTAD